MNESLKMSFMNRDVPCLVCGSQNKVRLYEATFAGSPSAASEYFLSHRKAVVHGNIVQCADCGFVFSNPQFAPDEYDEIYQMAPSPPEDDSSFQVARNIRFAQLANFVRQYVTRGPFLDMGCGAGGFLDAMNDARGLGFEVGPPGERRSPSGHRIMTGKFLDLVDREPFVDESFSFVTAFDVFEHLPDLPRYIESLQRLIRLHGHLVITVPNIESIVAKLTGERWNMILLEHLWYFSPRTLRQVVEPCGFEHVDTRSMPYASPLSHLWKRLAQTYRMEVPMLPQWIGSRVVPVPIGLMASVFRRV
jgi:SAM-dependent methyltransferase